MEIVKNAVVYCQLIIKKKVLNKRYDKVVSVIGSFDELNLKNDSIDFCIAWDAMHHSRDLIKTLKEAKSIKKRW